MMSSLKYRNISLIFLFLLLAVALFATMREGDAATSKRFVAQFSFINKLPACQVDGFDVARAQLAQFDKRYKIKNPNYFPWHVGPLQQLNWQLGLFVSREKKQVETHAGLLTPKGLAVRSPLIKLEKSSYFSFVAAVVDTKKRGRSATFVVELLSESGKQLLVRKYSHSAKPAAWREISLALGQFAGESVFLRLKAEGEKGVFPFWGEPVLYERKSFTKPNVIVILVDAMRWDALGCYGSKLGVSPNIDRYARQSAIFDCSVANANWTRPSELSMFTSVYPKDQRINQLDFPVSQAELDYFYKKARFETIPSIYKRNEYRTRGIVNNIFLQSFTGTGVDLGFDWMSDYRAITRDTADITTEALQWVRKHRDNPYFMFLNYNTPHKPYSAPKRFFEQIKDDPNWRYEYRVKEYLAEIAFADYYIGQLLDKMRKDGLLQNTIVVITADHGEVMWPFHNHSTVYSKYTRFGHSLTMLDEELRVPLIVYYPEKVAPQRVKKQVQLLDLFPTLVGLSGLTTTPQFKKQCKGQDLSPLLLHGKKIKKRAAYVQGFMLEGLRTDRYKYVYRPPGFDMIGPLGGPVTHRMPEELYDLLHDPQERTNIALRNKKQLQVMRTLFKKYRDRRIRNSLLFCSSSQKGVRFKGTVRTDGVFFVRPSAKSRGLRLSADGKQLHFSFLLGAAQKRKINFEVHPDYATLKFSIFRKQQPLPAQQFFMGKLGIAYLNGSLRIDTPLLFKASQSSSEPFPAAQGKQGVYFFREPDRFNITWSSGTTTLSTEIKTVLRDWGYVQR